jgi:hypothetical protein
LARKLEAIANTAETEVNAEMLFLREAQGTAKGQKIA